MVLETVQDLRDHPPTDQLVVLKQPQHAQEIIRLETEDVLNDSLATVLLEVVSVDLVVIGHEFSAGLLSNLAESLTFQHGVCQGEDSIDLLLDVFKVDMGPLDAAKVLRLGIGQGCDELVSQGL